MQPGERAPAGGPEDAQWRRPSDLKPEGAPTTAPGPGPAAGGIPAPPGYPGLAYPGPPAMTPPPSGWRPPHMVQPAEPRRLPAQDHARIDDQEARARTVTLGIGIVVAAIFLVTMCALCARVVF